MCEKIAKVMTAGEEINENSIKVFLTPTRRCVYVCVCVCELDLEPSLAPAASWADPNED